MAQAINGKYYLWTLESERNKPDPITTPPNLIAAGLKRCDECGELSPLEINTCDACGAFIVMFVAPKSK